MKIGDLVVRKSYGGDVLFRIDRVHAQTALLRGVEYRLLADAPITDLAAPPSNMIDQALDTRSGWDQGIIQQLLKNREDAIRRMTGYSGAKRRNYPEPGRLSYFEMPGRVLHLDGDANYFRRSMALYGHLRVPAKGLHVPETDMSAVLARLLPQVQPDIVVITGHDGILKQRKHEDIQNLTIYKNSLHFVRAVQVARQYEKHRDSMIIIAGACQSHFEALLQAGANFASSPARVLIHAFDPLYIAAKAAYTSITETVQLMDIIPHTMSGLDGLGGIETRGCFRVGIPGRNAGG